MVATLKDRQVELTRETILRALAELITDEGVAGFSIQAVANRAGVSHRTVYRYYPSREALLEGLAAWINARFAEAMGRAGGDPLPELTAAKLGEAAEVGFRVFADNAELAAAYVILAVGARIRLPERVQRTAWFEQRLAERTAHLGEAEAKAASVMIRAVASATTWHHMTEHSDADPKALTRAARWAIEALLDSLSRGGGPLPAGEDRGDRNEG